MVNINKTQTYKYVQSQNVNSNNNYVDFHPHDCKNNKGFIISKTGQDVENIYTLISRGGGSKLLHYFGEQFASTY